jgi:hypothetical protein
MQNIYYLGKSGPYAEYITQLAIPLCAMRFKQPVPPQQWEYNIDLTGLHEWASGCYTFTEGDKSGGYTTPDGIRFLRY